MARIRSNEKRTEFVKAAKKKRLSTNKCGYSGSDTPIYVDEQLTQHTFELLEQAKALKKVGMKYVWTSNGDVLCREKDDTPVTRISSHDKIKSIEKRLILSSKKNNKPAKNKKQNKPTTSVEQSSDDFYSDVD